MKTLMTFLILILSLSALAETKQKKKQKKAPLIIEEVDTKPSETTPKKAIDKADEVITNRLLRASSGSLSKWSGNFIFNYNGGSVQKPFAAQRPNIVSGADALTLQYMNANVGLRYRINELNSITFATGIFWNTPFNRTIKTNDPELKREFEKTRGAITVNDPNLIFTNLANLWGFQIQNQFTPTLITNAQQTQQGYRASWDIASTWMRQMNGFDSNLSLGAAFEWTGYAFSKSNRDLATNVWQVYPIIEYIINDWLNLRTLWGWQVYQQTRHDDTWTYDKRTVYQSFGTGISLSRDIFLYPNIQFIPSDMRDDRTNIGLSAYINL
jgi:hypothetical protein